MANYFANCGPKWPSNQTNYSLSLVSCFHACHPVLLASPLQLNEKTSIVKFDSLGYKSNWYRCGGLQALNERVRTIPNGATIAWSTKNEYSPGQFNRSCRLLISPFRLIKDLKLHPRIQLTWVSTKPGRSRIPAVKPQSHQKPYCPNPSFSSHAYSSDAHSS